MRQIPGRRVLGERLGGYIYGTIVVLAAMIEGQWRTPRELDHRGGGAARGDARPRQARRLQESGAGVNR
jgi:hypothetical protein